MRISRGSINHTLSEDLTTFLASVLKPSSCATRAASEQRLLLESDLKSYFSISNAVAFPYARTGVYAALKALNLAAGSEVLLTPVTIGPMYEVIISLGLKPVFVDIELKTFGPDLNDLAEKLKNSPPVFLLTYLFGYVPDMNAIMAACNAAGTRVIEDFSHNIGTTFNGRPVGTFGIAGVYSASLLKFVDGYNGAFVLTNDAQMAESLHLQEAELTDPDPRRIQGLIRRTFIWNTALNRFVFAAGTFPLLATLRKLSPRTFESLLGPSIRLNLTRNELPAYYFEDISDLQCRTISANLARLPRLLAQRRACAQTALESLCEVQGTAHCHPSTESDSQSQQHGYWQLLLAVRDLQKARDTLFRIGVETGGTNLMDLAYATGNSLKNARALKERHIFVPLHQHLTREHYLRIFRELQKAELI